MLLAEGHFREKERLALKERYRGWQVDRLGQGDLDLQLLDFMGQEMVAR